MGSQTLPLALGFSDGILNALVLAATAILRGGDGLAIGLGLRVGCVAFITAAVTMFIADYAERRSRLSRSAHQLNLSATGHLAATRLGRQVQLEALQSAGLASTASFLGAAIPLGIAGLVPGASWLGLLVAVGLLALLGAILAKAVDGRRRRWAPGLAAAGIAVAAVGWQLNIA